MKMKQTRVAPDVYKQLKAAAAVKGVPVRDYIDAILRKAVEKGKTK